MTPTQCRAFYAAALHGSFTAAARALSVSQPTVTTQVKQLEEYYDVELFHRDGRGVRLTDAGERLLLIVRRMYASQEEAKDYLRAVQGLHTGHLKVGAYGPYDVIAMLARFSRRYPGVETSLTLANSAQLQKAIRDYDLDVAVLSPVDDHPEFCSLAYSQPELVVVVGPKHPWKGRQVVEFGELRDQRIVCREPGSMVRRRFENAARDAGFAPRHVMEIRGREGVLAAVAEGIGISVIFDEGLIPEQSIAKLRIAGPRITTENYLVCLAERKGGSLIRAFLGVAEELVRERTA